jgi:hypothetical protein
MEKTHKASLRLAARILGAASAALALILWGLLIYNQQFFPESTGPDTYERMGLMAVLALLGILAALWGKPWLMLIIFAASFVPVGLYMLGVPSSYRLIGIADLLYLLSAVLLLLRPQPRPSPGARSENPGV